MALRCGFSTTQPKGERVVRAAYCWPLIATCLIAVAVPLQPVQAAPKLDVLIVDGQNLHNWQGTTPVLREMLEKSGRFTVEVVTSPPKDAPADAWAAFRPDFSKYDVVLTNYQGQRWPTEVEQAFVDYVNGGGGFVVYHFAVASWADWDAFNQMIGMGWRQADFGESLAMDDEGNIVRRAKGEGAGAGHGPQHPFEITVRDRKHPITKGLPPTWLHVQDELYHGQRGPCANMHILATAYDAPESGGTGLHELMAWTVSYGKGRVFVTLLGHDVEQTNAPDSVALLTRGAEWVATGKVTIRVPKGIQVPSKEPAP